MVRAVKAVQAAGLVVVRTEVHTDGRIVLHHQIDVAVQGQDVTGEAQEALASPAVEDPKAVGKPLLYSPKALAEFWQCSARHVRELIRTGELRGYRMGKKLLRIRREEAEAYQARQQTLAGEVRAAVDEPPTKRPRAKRLDVGPNASLRAFKAQRA